MNRLSRTLRSIFLAAVCLLALQAGRSLAQDGQAFLSDIQDLPLMRGLEEIEGQGLAFDKPSGRIVEAHAVGDLEEAEVRRFYERTLSQLGWQPAGRDTFHREGEVLSISFERSGGHLVVGFTLQPG
mgnify:CR=1 FL=1